MQRIGLGFLIAAVLVSAGCSGDLPRAKVKGAIKYKGAPLTKSTLMLLTRDNQVYRTELGENGAYELDGVPMGPVRVCIQQELPTVTPRPDPPPGARPDKEAQGESRDAKWKAPEVEVKLGDRLPAKYGDPNQSGLAFELTQDGQDFSVDLQ